MPTIRMTCAQIASKKLSRVSMVVGMMASVRNWVSLRVPKKLG